MIRNVTLINSVESHELSIFRTLKQQSDNRREGLFVAEGHFVVERLLHTTFCIRSVLFTQVWFDNFRYALEKRPEEIDVYIGEKAELSKITGYELHQYIMACAEIPECCTIDQIVQSRTRPLLLMALDGLTSSDNVGLVVRNCAAFGVDALIAGETTADPWLRRAIRKSMGTVFKVPVIYSDSLVNSIQTLRHAYDCDVFGAQVTAQSSNIYNMNFKRNCCIIMGNEGSGISTDILNACSKTVYIPMADGVDSLNVSSAASVILSEAVRQRKWLW